jgi:hypothetical protein
MGIFFDNYRPLAKISLPLSGRMDKRIIVRFEDIFQKFCDAIHLPFQALPHLSWFSGL